MEKKWTEAQQACIDLHGGNILVSAAAGSGKTAVLTARVISMITDGNSPVDVDKLLVVTFTNAAAAEMKSRISSSLRNIIKKNPNDKNLKRQYSLLASADICSIDSFCLSLVKENFFELGISNDFTILDDSENDIITENAINDVLEEYYKEKSGAFTELVQALTKPDNDRALIESLKKLLYFISAQSFPFDWLDSVIEYYNPAVSFENSVWWDLYKERITMLLNDCSALCRYSSDIVPIDDEHLKLAQMLNSDSQIIESLKGALNQGLDVLINAMPPSFATFPRSKAFDPQIKDIVKTNRDAYKAKSGIINNTIAKLLVSSQSDYSEDMQYLYPVFKTLSTMLKKINARIYDIKNDKESYSFSDIEHFALDLLVKKDDCGSITDTALAKELKLKYHEILVDEYQDTNEAQDTLFEFLSTGNNRFMVGDVKQSIYRFRLAMPQIFTSKRKEYHKYDGSNVQFPCTVTLDKNFRSRSGVCAYVNHLFSIFMTESNGDLNYDKDEFLNPGAEYEPTNVPCAQIKILDGVSGENADKLEAAYIAVTIQNKINSGEKIYDNGALRPIEYKDIVIMMRSMKNHSKYYADVLTAYGIPVICDNTTNLFDNGEIQMILSLLRIIDNPMQDIELLSLMLSPIYGFTPDELSDIRINHRSGMLYSAVFDCKTDKAAAFIADIQNLRKTAVTMSTEAFIRYVIDIKSIYSYAYAMGNGKQREQNIEVFIGIAQRFDKGENVGITAFMRYLDTIIASDSKTNGAPITGASDNSVKIMTIHHSKGLEYPVCILAGADRKYNYSDRDMAKIIVDSRYGPAMKCHNEENFCSYNSLPYMAVKSRINHSMISENLRVLYVAMTRAKEQFITFISTKNIESKIKKLAGYMINGKPLAYVAEKVMYDGDFILMSALCHKDGGVLRNIAPFDVPLAASDSDFDMSIEIINDIDEINTDKTEQTAGYNQNTINEIAKKLDYKYPYAHLSAISAKRNASDLDSIENEMSHIASFKPSFLCASGLTPAQRGTAMHTFMQFCNYNNAKNNLDAEIENVKSHGFLSGEQADSLDRKKLSDLFNGDFGKRLLSSPKIHRELKIASFMKASEIENVSCEDEIFVQGIADCVFEENDYLILVDYKTDRINNGDELLERYKNQLKFYKKAVASALNKPVLQVCLYSFHLSRAFMYNEF